MRLTEDLLDNAITVLAPGVGLEQQKAFGDRLQVFFCFDLEDRCQFGCKLCILIIQGLPL